MDTAQKQTALEERHDVQKDVPSPAALDGLSLPRRNALTAVSPPQTREIRSDDPSISGYVPATEADASVLSSETHETYAKLGLAVAKSWFGLDVGRKVTKVTRREANEPPTS